MPTWNHETGELTIDWDNAPEFKNGHEVTEWVKREASAIDRQKDHDKLYALQQPYIAAQQRQQAPDSAAQYRQHWQNLVQQADAGNREAQIAVAYVQHGRAAVLAEQADGLNSAIDSNFQPEQAQRVHSAPDFNVAFREAKHVGQEEVAAEKRRREAPMTTTSRPMSSYFAASAAEKGYQPQS